MENTTGSITPFLVGKLPKEKYSDVNEFAKDLANALRIDQDKVVVTLIPSADIKGEQGKTGPRGTTGKTGSAGIAGPKGDTGDDGAGLVWFGPWVLTTTHVVNEIVSNDGILYIAIQDHIAAADNEPGVGVNQATYWDVFFTPVPILGTATNDDAAVGYVGELVSSYIALGSAVALTDSVADNITSISLTAGDWDVEGYVSFNAASATVTQLAGGISLVTDTVPAQGGIWSGLTSTTSSFLDSITIPRKRVSIAATTTVFLCVNAAFSAGTVSGYGEITARRVR